MMFCDSSVISASSNLAGLLRMSRPWQCADCTVSGLDYQPGLPPYPASVLLLTF